MQAENQTFTVRARDQEDRQTISHPITHFLNQTSSPTAACLPDQLHWQPDRQTAHSTQHGDRLTLGNQLYVFEHKQRINRVLAMEVTANKNMLAPRESRSKKKNDFTLISN